MMLRAECLTGKDNKKYRQGQCLSWPTSHATVHEN